MEPGPSKRRDDRRSRCYGKFPKTFGRACHWQWWMLRPAYKSRWFNEVVKSSRLLSAGTWGHPRYRQLRERGLIRFNVSSSVTLDSRIYVLEIHFAILFLLLPLIQFGFSTAHPKSRLAIQFKFGSTNENFWKDEKWNLRFACRKIER